MTGNRPEPQKTGPLFAGMCDYRAISTKGEHAGSAAAPPSAASAGSVSVGETGMDNDSRLTLEQEIADLRFALRQATDRASLAEVKCSQLLAAGRLTDAERVALMWALATLETEAADDAGQNAEAAATLRGLLERLGGGR